MTNNQPYEQIEHTGDVGLRVYGQSLEELFSHAAHGMYGIIFDKLPTDTQIQEALTLSANDLEELFVNWLSELNFILTTEDKYFIDFTFHEITENSVKVTMRGGSFKPDIHDIHTEIKAATFHELHVRKIDNQWQAQVIFDI